MNAVRHSPGDCAVVLRRLRARGFAVQTEEEACRVGPWLRFTPMLQALLFGVSTVTESVAVFYGLAGVLAVGLVFGSHPFDWIYNCVIRTLEHSPELPPTPPRRRLVFLVGMLWCIATGAAFATGNTMLGCLLGLLMTASTALLAMTHICIPSLVLARLRGVLRRDDRSA